MLLSLPPPPPPPLPFPTLSLSLSLSLPPVISLLMDGARRNLILTMPGDLVEYSVRLGCNNYLESMR